MRRNKNVGTKAHGHGSNNKLAIPESWHESKRYYEKLSSYTVVTRTVGTRELRFFIEPTRPDWFYPCTVDDICAVLSRCSSEVLSAFDFIVMRQPTRKQRILCPVEWSNSIDPECARELDRLSQDVTMFTTRAEESRFE